MQIESRWKEEVESLSRNNQQTTINIDEDAVLLKPLPFTRKVRIFKPGFLDLAK